MECTVLWCCGGVTSVTARNWKPTQSHQTVNTPAIDSLGLPSPHRDHWQPLRWTQTGQRLSDILCDAVSAPRSYLYGSPHQPMQVGDLQSVNQNSGGGSWALTPSYSERCRAHCHASTTVPANWRGSEITVRGVCGASVSHSSTLLVARRTFQQERTCRRCA